eukprot:TRINITY_DN7992_c0_g1_i1.p1 TRINITY_DN7992_c0_g1~~TRINITY_DN7992_c0_g1_i1.p1  ORF type:complete len:1209 (+),score=182.38 TRINITY_DN7992_c0_g1_i1:120-3746(+)
MSISSLKGRNSGQRPRIPSPSVPYALALGSTPFPRKPSVASKAIVTVVNLEGGLPIVVSAAQSHKIPRSMSLHKLGSISGDIPNASQFRRAQIPQSASAEFSGLDLQREEQTLQAERRPTGVSIESLSSSADVVNVESSASGKRPSSVSLTVPERQPRKFRIGSSAASTVSFVRPFEQFLDIPGRSPQDSPASTHRSSMSASSARDLSPVVSLSWSSPPTVTPPVKDAHVTAALPQRLGVRQSPVAMAGGGGGGGGGLRHAELAATGFVHKSAEDSEQHLRAEPAPMRTVSGQVVPMIMAVQTPHGTTVAVHAPKFDAIPPRLAREQEKFGRRVSPVAHLRQPTDSEAAAQQFLASSLLVSMENDTPVPRKFPRMSLLSTDQLLNLVFQHADLKTLVQLALVCKKWNVLSRKFVQKLNGSGRRDTPLESLVRVFPNITELDVSNSLVLEDNLGALANWNKLTSLDISKCMDIDRRQLPSLLKNAMLLKSLKMVTIPCNDISLAELLFAIDRLEHFEFGGKYTQWSTEGARALGNTCLHLKTLVLHEFKCDDDTISTLLQESSSIERVSLIRMEVAAMTLRSVSLVGLDVDTCTSLRTLDVESCPALRELSVASCVVVKSIRTVLRGCTMLRKLNLTAAEWPSHSLRRVVKMMPNLREFSLNRCPTVTNEVLGADEMSRVKYLRHFIIKHCNNLRRLSLPCLANVEIIELESNLHLELFQLCLPRLQSMKIRNHALLKTLEFMLPSIPTPHDYQNLTHLQVIGCPALPTEWLARLSSGFASLVEVDLTGTHVLDDHIADLCWNYTKLLQLNLTDCPRLCKLGIYSASLTALTANRCTRLIRCKVEGFKLRSLLLQDCTAMTSLLLDAPEIQVLDISGCSKVGEGGVQMFCGHQLYRLLMRNCANIRCIELKHPTVAEIDLSQCARLESLTLSCPRLESLALQECTSLIHPVFEAGELARLSLARCDRMTSLVSLMLMCTGLEVLDLKGLGKGHRSLSDAVLIRAISMASRLMELDVSECSRLEQVHIFTPSLRVLRANSCISLKTVVLQCHYLNRLEFRGTPIDTACLTAFLSTSCPNLRVLDLQGSSVSVADLKLMVKLYHPEKSLKVIYPSKTTRSAPDPAAVAVAVAAAFRLNSETEQAAVPTKAPTRAQPATPSKVARLLPPKLSLTGPMSPSLPQPRPIGLRGQLLAATTLAPNIRINSHVISQ